MAQIIIVGLGPGNIDLITLETLNILKSCKNILLRTAKHPAVDGLTAAGIAFESCDHYYDELGTFEEVYQAIAEECIARAREKGGLVYVVPGSPMVAEKSVALLRDLAKQAGIETKLLPGMSFLEILYARLGIDPLDGVTVVDYSDIASLPADLNTGLIVTQVYNKQIASDTKLSLMEYYRDDYRVTVVRHLGLPDEEILTVKLYEIDRLPAIDHLTSLYVPPRQDGSQTFDLGPLIDVMAKLRSPGGCLWDIEQSHQSLRRYFIEEVYEVIEAIELGDEDKLCEELGDVLLQIVFHARVAEESGAFSMQDVIDGVTEKLIRRHPHVFGDITVKDAAEVVVNWDKIKSREKNGVSAGVLSGVPIGLPSLMRAYKLQAKAAKVGFDWSNIEPVWGKLDEELAELNQAVRSGGNKAIEEELGDVLFTLVNLSRFWDIDPETALTATNNKFIRRFNFIETYIKKNGLKWNKMDIKQLDFLWEAAKSSEIK